MDGIQKLPESREPMRKIPRDWTGMRIGLRMTGGVGDVIMTIGGTAGTLATRDCTVVAGVLPHQKDLLHVMSGVDEVVDVKQFNHPSFVNSHDVVVDFRHVFNTARSFRRGEYYDLISERVGMPIVPGSFQFLWEPLARRDVDDVSRDCVAIHPGSSNPNRRWAESKWRDLAFQLCDLGFCVRWLGTRDEFGFNSEDIHKLSDVSDNLLWQSKQLASCHYFVGNDSGFAHVAGVLGVPGCVLFSATHPNDVIARYPSLKGVTKFDESNGLRPSRSLRADDPLAARCLDAIQVEDVLQTGFAGIEPERCVARKEVASMHTQIAVVGRTSKADHLASYLSRHYDVELLEEVPAFGSKFKVVVICDPTRCRVRVQDGREVCIEMGDYETVRRSLRELCSGLDGNDFL